MSTQYQSGKDVPTEALAARLNELAHVVARKRDRIGDEFTMRIPAECDRDADLVMSEAARRLSAAPAVQGEPVGWQFYQHGEWRNGDHRIKDHRKNTEEAGFRVRDVYAAPPAVQGEPVAEEVTLLECVSCNHLYQGYVTQCDCMPDEQKFNRWLARPERAGQQPISHDWDDQDKCRRCGDRDWYASDTCTPKQQPAPDVYALVEALEIISDTDPNEGTAWFHEIAYKALAAHRKGGE